MKSFIRQARLLKMMRELHCGVVGLLAHQHLEGSADSLVQIGTFHAVEALEEVPLKQDVAETIDRKSLCSRTPHVERAHEVVAFVGFLAQEPDHRALVDVLDARDDFRGEVFTRHAGHFQDSLKLFGEAADTVGDDRLGADGQLVPVERLRHDVAAVRVLDEDVALTQVAKKLHRE